MKRIYRSVIHSSFCVEHILKRFLIKSIDLFSFSFNETFPLLVVHFHQINSHSPECYHEDNIYAKLSICFRIFFIQLNRKSWFDVSNTWFQSNNWDKMRLNAKNRWNKIKLKWHSAFIGNIHTSTPRCIYLPSSQSNILKFALNWNSFFVRNFNSTLKKSIEISFHENHNDLSLMWKRSAVILLISTILLWGKHCNDSAHGFPEHFKSHFIPFFLDRGHISVFMTR